MNRLSKLLALSGAGCWSILAASPAIAAAGRLGGGSSLDISLSRIVAALLACAAIAFLAALALRKGGGKLELATLFGRLDLRKAALEVVQTRRLSVHADICLVRHGGREYLLLLAAGKPMLLSENEAPAGGEAPCG